MSTALPLLLTAFAAMAGAMVLGWLPRYLTSAKPLTFASVFQCGYRFNSYIALGLIAVGAALRLQSQEGGVRALAIWLTAVKLLALPAMAAIVGKLAGLGGLPYRVVVLFAAMPTASSAYILTMRMGGDGRTVAWLISVSTLASMLTLPLWAAWVVG